MGQRVKNAAGDELELVDGQWVPVGRVAPQQERSAVQLLQGSGMDRFGEAMAVSAGDQFTTMGRNARDVYAMIRGDDKARLAIQDERVEADRIRANLHEESPWGAGIGAMLPTLPLALLSGGTAAAPGVMGAIGVGGRAAAQSAALGAVQSESGDYFEDAAKGAGLSVGTSMAGQIIGRVKAGRAAMAEARAATGGGMAAQQASNLNEAERDIMAGARRVGLQLLPGQEAGNPTYRKIEAGLAGNPFTSKFFDDVKQGNESVLNRLAARAMGQEADNVGPAVRMAAEHQTGAMFDEVGQRLGRVDIDPMIKQVGDMAAKEALEGAPRMELKSIYHNLVGGQKERAAAVGADEGRFITGESMMTMRSTLSGKMRDAYNKGESQKGELYADVLKVYDQAIEDAASQMAHKGGPAAAETIELYGRARDQWNVWRALDRGGATPDGHVNVHAMARNVGGGDKSGYIGRAGESGEQLMRRGSGTVGENPVGDLYDGLRFFTSRLGKPIVPNTGGTVGVFNNWLNSGSGVSSIAKGGLGLAATPLMKTYQNHSPLATQAMMFTQQALKGQPTGGTGFDVAQQFARSANVGLGGLGGLGL